MGDNSMYCMIPDPFPSSAFGKGSAMPDYFSLGLSGMSLKEEQLSAIKAVL